MSQLPTGWEQCALEQIVQDVTYGYTAKSNSSVGDARMLRITDIQNNKVDWTSVPYCQISTADTQKYALRKLDLVFARTGATVGKSFLIKEEVKQAVFASYLIRVRPSLTEMAGYLSYFFGSDSYWNQIVDFSAGIGQPNVNGSKLKQLQIPLAPLPEQKRIADKLDSVLARVDACRDRLDRLPGLLKRFRRSILDAATSGRLTKDWRSQPENISQTPACWTICKIKDAGKIQLGRQRSPKFHSGENMRPYLRVQNVYEDRLDLSDVMSMDFPGEDFERYQLYPGDILLNEGQSPEYLGRPAMYRGELPGACFTNTLIRFQAYSHVKPEYALMVFRNHMHSGRYITEGTITTNIAHLGAGRFSEVEFPLPPQEEQTEIVRRVELLFAFADRLEARLATARRQVGQLTPALLAKAFRGELVAQDPADEPAAELLKRLAAQRAAAPKAKRGRSPT
ncbi:MAG: Restriction endonuclease subunit-like protein [Proteobacteria bacterium]|nr:Restriction endonuclease subunit-like protein [Pseudomonadota bacterium]